MNDYIKWLPTYSYVWQGESGRLAKFRSLNTKRKTIKMLLGKYPLSLFLVVKHAFSSGNGALPNEHHTTNTTTMTMFSFFSQPNRIPGIRSIDIKCSSTILDPQLKAFAYLLLKKISVVLLIHHISAPRKPPIYIYI